MKQKTAMMELIDMFEADAKEYELDNVTIYSIINLYKKQAIKLLEKEKEQIEEAYRNGFNNGIDMANPISIVKQITPWVYYNETYKED